MAKRKLSPLVQAMNIFSEMDERDKVTLAEYIKSQSPRKVKDPKSTASSAGKRSSRKPGATQSTASSETGKDAAGTATNKPEPIVLPANPDEFHSKAAGV